MLTDLVYAYSYNNYIGIQLWWDRLLVLVNHSAKWNMAINTVVV